MPMDQLSRVIGIITKFMGMVSLFGVMEDNIMDNGSITSCTALVILKGGRMVVSIMVSSKMIRNMGMASIFGPIDVSMKVTGGKINSTAMAFIQVQIRSLEYGNTENVLNGSMKKL